MQYTNFCRTNKLQLKYVQFAHGCQQNGEREQVKQYPSVTVTQSGHCFTNEMAWMK